MMPYIFRFGIFSIKTGIARSFLEITLKWLPLDIAIFLAVNVALKLYNRVWTYASVGELYDCAKSAVITEALCMAYKMIFGIYMFRSYYPFNFMIMGMLLGMSRISIRVIRGAQKRRNKKGDTHNVMIIGGGAAATMLIKEYQLSSRRIKICCIIDDNPEKKGKRLMDVPIIGGRENIVNAADKYDVDEIVIAIPSAAPAVIRDLIMICQETSARVRRLPAIASTLTDSLSSAVRDINYEDLLGRDTVIIKNPELHAFLNDKVVMVTGGGGSIGSELCRQIVANEPKKLVIVDIYENSTYELEVELRRYYPNADIEVLIASVRDYDRLDTIFAAYRPDVIYHAAAHKHVPLMETSPNEAIKNNCLGTLNLAKLADKYKVKRFVMISTDKAVRPTNVMGATKRICEMIVQTYNKKSETEFVAVRFGNVLGSNGSVIPLFLKQIDEGGPVTLTHREITRFFMTIPEAVSLVLTAGLMAKGGEIFILDMGEPVKIYDLACNLIKMKGYVPEVDIKIEVVGLRPGEKLYEELLMSEEGLQETENKKIHIGKPIEIDEKVFLDKLDRLIDKAEDNMANIRKDIKDICPTYNPNNEK
ncbi:MAG: polysaccharide biosynthesis protein [Mogibacterium sp.]|nr:polysaccharide biosynthesis protein [Mogibacterium sp.]MBQ6500994.1 polysaccharide biosynthesis protein [Mogibacterium sp.]